jgi:hypothetical protein
MTAVAEAPTALLDEAITTIFSNQAFLGRLLAAEFDGVDERRRASPPGSRRCLADASLAVSLQCGGESRRRV